MLASNGGTAVDVVLVVSIVIPIAVTIWLAWFFLHGRATDPDELRWKRLAEQRRAEAEAESERDGGGG